MTRRALAITVGVVGTIVAALTLLLLLVMGSVFADARTDKIVGPGVDVFLRTPFPTEESTIALDVEARGGSKAGISSVQVKVYDLEVARGFGEGASWGYAIHSGRERGSSTKRVSFKVPPVKPGTVLPLEITVDYVVAMSSGNTFNNESKHDVVTLGVEVYTPRGRLGAQISRVALALGCFVVWFFIIWGIAKLYAKAPDADGAFSRSRNELEGIGLLMGFMGGSVLGYWLFAWRVMNALELASMFWTFLLMAFWCVVPLWWIWRWWRARKATALPSARVVTR